MKQLLQSYRTGVMEVADVPAPALLPGHVLVRVRASLVSAGTEKLMLDLAKKSLVGKAAERPDLVKKVLDKVSKDGVVDTAKAVFARLDQPVPVGYSAAGTVIEAGQGAEAFSAGARVAIAGAKAANHAEIDLVPLNLCVPVPDAVPDEEAAFVTVGAIAMQGVRTAKLTLGERVGVIGLGLIGQLVVQLCRANGCRVFGIDLDPSKVALAKALGAEEAFLRGDDVVSRARAFSDGRGLDAVIICAAAASNDPVELAGELCRDRGRVAVVGAVGMNVPRRPYYDKELELLQSRSYGPGRYDPSYEEAGHDYPFGYVRWTEARNMSSFLELCADGRVKLAPLVSHRFDIDAATDAYRLISGETGEPFLGVVLRYPGEHVPLERTVRTAAPAAKGFRPEFPRVSVVGAGAFATAVLVPELAKVEKVRLSIVSSARGISARHLANQFGFAACSTEVDEVLSGQDADAVVIATRHDLHPSQTARVLRAGKAVFVEKPVAIDEAGLRLVVDALRGSRGAYLVDFNRRFAPLTVQLRDHFRGRSEPLVIQYRVNAGAIPGDSWIHDPKVGGGRIVGEVCHFIDWCDAVVGREIVQVQATSVTGAKAPHRNDDQVLLSCRFADGSVASVVYVSSGDGALPKERVEVHGGGSSAILEDFRSLELLRGGKVQRKRTLGKDKGHGAALRAFFDAMRSGQRFPIPPRSFVATTLATFAAASSLNDGRAVDLSALTDELCAGL